MKKNDRADGFHVRPYFKEGCRCDLRNNTKLLRSQCKLREILFLDRALRGKKKKKDISFWQMADCGLSTKE